MASNTFSLFNTPGSNQYTPGTGLPPVSNSGGSPTSTVDYSMFSTPTTSTSGTPVSPGVGAVAPSSVPQGPLQYAPGDVSGTQTNKSTGITTLMPEDPQLSNTFNQFLQGQIGQGAAPYNQSAVLPSSGQATAPGQLNAPLTQLLQQLQQFYATGTGGPTGSSTLQSMSQTGNPTDSGPAWNAMVASEGQNTAQNANNLREQFAFGGDLKSSPFGTAMQEFYNQNTLNQNAQLTAAQQAAQEAAAGRQLTASTTLNSGAQSLGGSLQTLDQNAIQNMLAEFIRTSPDYSPLLNTQEAAATTYPPSTQTGVGLSGAGALASGAGTALQGVADLWASLNQKSSS